MSAGVIETSVRARACIEARVAAASGDIAAKRALCALDTVSETKGESER